MIYVSGVEMSQNSRYAMFVDLYYPRLFRRIEKRQQLFRDFFKELIEHMVCNI